LGGTSGCVARQLSGLLGVTGRLRMMVVEEEPGGVALTQGRKLGLGVEGIYWGNFVVGGFFPQMNFGK
jgi:hypothetical protein